MNVLLACISVHMCDWYPQGSEESNWTIIVNHCVGARTQTPFLCKNSECSQPLSQHSSPLFLFFEVLCVSVCLCMSILSCVFRYLWGPEEGVGSHEARVTLVVRGHLTAEEALNKQTLWSLAEEMAWK